MALPFPDRFRSGSSFSAAAAPPFATSSSPPGAVAPPGPRMPWPGWVILPTSGRKERTIAHRNGLRAREGSRGRGRLPSRGLGLSGCASRIGNLRGFFPLFGRRRSCGGIPRHHIAMWHIACVRRV